MKVAVTVLALAVAAMVAVPGIAATKPAPNFVLKQGNGESLELKSLRGKVVVINFWATWCGPCRAEIPAMLEVYEKLKGKGLEIVGVSLDRPGFSVVTPFVSKMKIVYPVVLGDDKTVEAYGNFQAIPTTFVVDRKGNIVEEHTGSVTKAQFEKMVTPYL